MTSEKRLPVPGIIAVGTLVAVSLSSADTETVGWREEMRGFLFFSFLWVSLVY